MSIPLKSNLNIKRDELFFVTSKQLKAFEKLQIYFKNVYSKL